MSYRFTRESKPEADPQITYSWQTVIHIQQNLSSNC